MGTVPIVIFRGLRQSRAQGLGELGTLQPCRMEAGARWNTEYVPGRQFAISIQVLNRGRNGCLNHGFVST